MKSILKNYIHLYSVFQVLTILLRIYVKTLETPKYFSRFYHIWKSRRYWYGKVCLWIKYSLCSKQLTYLLNIIHVKVEDGLGLCC